jgi:hypothetical protein
MRTRELIRLYVLALVLFGCGLRIEAARFSDALPETEYVSPVDLLATDAVLRAYSREVADAAYDRAIEDGSTNWQAALAAQGAALAGGAAGIATNAYRLADESESESFQTFENGTAYVYRITEVTAITNRVYFTGTGETDYGTISSGWFISDSQGWHMSLSEAFPEEQEYWVWLRSTGGWKVLTSDGRDHALTPGSGDMPQSIDAGANGALYSMTGTFAWERAESITTNRMALATAMDVGAAAAAVTGLVNSAISSIPTNLVAGWQVPDVGSNDWVQVLCSNRLLTVWEVVP